MQMAALYLRLSKEDMEKEQNTHSRSIENQKEILEKYASLHSFIIYKLYTDDDYSGLYFERPAFSEMLEDAQNHKFTVILAEIPVQTFKKYGTYRVFASRFVPFAWNTVHRSGRRS